MCPSFCQLIIGVGTPLAAAAKVTACPSLTETFDIRSTKRGA